MGHTRGIQIGEVESIDADVDRFINSTSGPLRDMMSHYPLLTPI